MSHQNVQGRRRYNTLASPSLPNAFQRAVISARESPRARLTSQVAPDARTASSHQRRKQAITLSGDGLAPPQLNADWSNPVILEMRKGLLLDVGSVLSQFSMMDRNIRTFCEESSDHLARTKRLPRMTAQSSALPENSTISKLAHEFGSPEEYIFFVLLSIINTHLYEDIFRPFHPAASVQESDRYEKEYLELIDTSLQMQSATWRSQRFSLIDNRMSVDGVANLIRRFAGTIIDELVKVLEQSTGPTSFPDTFVSGLESILKDAYDWNRTVRKDILKYDFEPYVVEPSATWDPTQMESFERLRIPMRPNSNVISPVSLGLVGSVSLGNARVSRVQRKARVLLEEWFASGPTGRTMNTSPGPRSATPVAPVPPYPRPTGPRITEQPRPTPPMTTIPPLGTPQPAPASGPRRGSVPGPSSAAPVPLVPSRPTGPRVTEQPRPTLPMTTIPKSGTLQPALPYGQRKVHPPGAVPAPPAPAGTGTRVTEQPRPTLPMTIIPQPGTLQPGGPRRASLPGPSSVAPVSPVPPDSCPTGPRVTEQPRPTPPMTTIPQPGRPQPTPAGGPRRGSEFMCC